VIDDGLVGLMGMILLYCFGQIFLPNEPISVKKESPKMDVNE